MKQALSNLQISSTEEMSANINNFFKNNFYVSSSDMEQDNHNSGYKIEWEQHKFDFSSAYNIRTYHILLI